MAYLKADNFVLLSGNSDKFARSTFDNIAIGKQLLLFYEGLAVSNWKNLSISIYSNSINILIFIKLQAYEQLTFN